MQNIGAKSSNLLETYIQTAFGVFASSAARAFFADVDFIGSFLFSPSRQI